MSTASQLSQVVFALSTSELTGEINLKPEAWRILSLVNGVRTLSEIARAIGMDDSVACNIANTLLQARILEIVPGAAPPVSSYVDDAFFALGTRELARAIGPLATLIVEETLAALGETRERFPRDRVAELIERLSEEIRDGTKRLQFQQAMLEAIRKL